MAYKAFEDTDYSKFPRDVWEKMFQDDADMMLQGLIRYLQQISKVIDHPYDRWEHMKHLRDAISFAVMDIGEQRAQAQKEGGNILDGLGK